jgi:3-dehydroquinate synthase
MIVVVDCTQGEVGALWLFDKRTSKGLSRDHFPVGEFGIPSDLRGLDQFLCSLVAYIHPQPVSAVVLITPENHAASEVTFLVRSPIPVLRIPSWRTMAQMAAQTLYHFLERDGSVLDDRPGSCICTKDAPLGPEISTSTEPTRKLATDHHHPKAARFDQSVEPSWSQGGNEYTVAARRDISYTVVYPTQYLFDPHCTDLLRIVDGRPVLAAVDERVHGHYGKDIRRYLERYAKDHTYLLVDGSECAKDWRQVEHICNEAVRVNLPRHGIMMAVGGGVTLDVVGFAASIYRRGVPYLRVPTSLIGLVDAGLGVKQGTNFAGKKNILGAFYPPIATFCDQTFLRTLSERDIASGIAEIIKIAIIRDETLFRDLEENAGVLVASRFQRPEAAREIIHHAGRLMIQELQQNLFESDLRRLVDLGHSFSPLIETASSYSITHGEAVGLDILISSRIAVLRGLCAPIILDRIINLYRAVGLPLSQDVCTAQDLLVGLERIRAHRGGDLNLPIPREMGRADFVQEVYAEEVEECLAFFAEYSKSVNVSNFV